MPGANWMREKSSWRMPTGTLLKARRNLCEFGSDAKRIGVIGKVFPFIFFLVAVLVSLTTMTRMVEEPRMQIGTLKALGYGKWSIASKYIGYALPATLAESILGSAAGEKLIPYVIMTAYFILYENLPVCCHRRWH